MKVIKAHNVFAVLRGLLLLAFGVFQIAVGIIGMNPSGAEGEVNPIGGLFVTLFSAIGLILIITGAVTTLYSLLVFGNIKRTRRGISRGFVIIDVIANIVAVIIAVIVLFSDGEDANVYACLILSAIAIIGFAFDVVAYGAFKAVRGGSYDFERNLVRSRSFQALTVLGSLFGIIPSLAFSVFAVSLDNNLGESAYNIPLVYANIVAVCVSAVLTVALAATFGKGKGGFSALLLSLSAVVSAVLTGISLKNTVGIAIIAGIGFALLALAGVSALAANAKRRREEERNARRFERDYMRAHRDR